METIFDLLKKTHALISDDHFVYTSGLHGNTYVNKDALFPHTSETSKVGRLFAEKCKDKNIDVVVGPALGGIVLSQWTAHHLSEINGREVLGVYTEKTADKNQILTRGYDSFIKGKNILVVEDIATTGGSVAKVVNTVREAGGNVVAVGVMINRNPKIVDEKIIGAPFFSLGDLEIPSYQASDCPFCKQGIPVNLKIGKGKEFLH